MWLFSLTHQRTRPPCRVEQLDQRGDAGLPVSRRGIALSSARVRAGQRSGASVRRRAYRRGRDRYFVRAEEDIAFVGNCAQPLPVPPTACSRRCPLDGHAVRDERSAAPSANPAPPTFSRSRRSPRPRPRPPRARVPMPTADGACLPTLSPSTSVIRSEAPFTTFVRSVKSGTALTKAHHFYHARDLPRSPRAA